MWFAGSADDHAYGSPERIDGPFHEFGKGCGIRPPPLKYFRSGSVARGNNAQAVAGPLDGVTHVDEKMLSMPPNVVIVGDSDFTSRTIAGIGEPMRADLVSELRVSRTWGGRYHGSVARCRIGGRRGTC